MIGFIISTIAVIACIGWCFAGLCGREVNGIKLMVLVPFMMALFTIYPWIWEENIVKPQYEKYGLPLMTEFSNGCLIHAEMPISMSKPEEKELGWYPCRQYKAYLYFIENNLKK